MATKKKTAKRPSRRQIALAIRYSEEERAMLREASEASELSHRELVVAAVAEYAKRHKLKGVKIVGA